MTDDSHTIRRALCDPHRIAEALGIARNPRERNKWVCPSHGGGSLSLRLGPDHTLQVRCFGCDLAGDVFALVAAAEGLDLKRDFAKVAAVARELAGLPQPGQREHRGRALPGPRPPSMPKAKAPSYPPHGDVAALWESATDLWKSPRAAAYLRDRGLDPLAARGRGLLRLLTTDSPRFGWAGFASGRSWFEAGYRLVSPCYDATGELRALRAWHPEPRPGAPKRVAPTGFTTKGLVLADFLGADLLRGELTGPLRIVIAEGEPDTLAWSAASPLTDLTHRWATLGVFAGGWTQELGARIPAGSTVTLATDHDSPGEAYAAALASSLHHCDVRRLRTQGAA